MTPRRRCGGGGRELDAAFLESRGNASCEGRLDSGLGWGWGFGGEAWDAFQSSAEPLGVALMAPPQHRYSAFTLERHATARGVGAVRHAPASSSPLTPLCRGHPPASIPNFRLCLTFASSNRTRWSHVRTGGLIHCRPVSVSFVVGGKGGNRPAPKPGIGRQQQSLFGSRGGLGRPSTWIPRAIVSTACVASRQRTPAGAGRSLSFSKVSTLFFLVSGTLLHVPSNLALPSTEDTATRAPFVSCAPSNLLRDVYSGVFTDESTFNDRARHERNIKLCEQKN